MKQSKGKYVFQSYKKTMYKLNNKVAIVTGGARGIGQGIARTLATYGCKIAILDIEDEAGDQTVKELNALTESIYIHCDVSIVASIQESFEKVIQKFGFVNILINNAAIPIRDYVKDITEEKWDRYLDINTKSVFFFSKIFSEQIKDKELGYGRIVNLSSVRAFLTDTYHPGYCITKAAVNKITKVFAVSYGEYGVTSNAVALGFVKTNMTAHYNEDSDIQEMLRKLSPSGRAVEIQEVADTVCFLVSAQASAISGQIITIDGGGTCSEGNFY